MVYGSLSVRKLGVQTVGVSCLKDGKIMDFVGIFVPEAAVTDVTEALLVHYRRKQRILQALLDAPTVDSCSSNSSGSSSGSSSASSSTSSSDSSSTSSIYSIQDTNELAYSSDGSEITNTTVDENVSNLMDVCTSDSDDVCDESEDGNVF